MNDNGLRVIGYLIKSQREWSPECDVTLDDAIISGMLPLEIEMANDAIEKMIREYY